MAKTTNYGVTVTLEEPLAKAIAEHMRLPGSVAETLGVVASGLLDDLARGGAMLAPEWAKRIKEAIGTLDTPTIVEHVEKAVNRCGETERIEWIPDPTWLGFLRSQAENAGMTLKEQLKAHLDFALYNGWLGNSAPDPFKLLLSREQYRELQQLFKKDDVTGQDVIEYVRQQEAPTFVQGEVEDPVLDAIGE